MNGLKEECEMKDKSRCPHCGIELNKDTIGFYSEDSSYYDEAYLEDGLAGYDLGEIGKFYCKKCNSNLMLSEDEVEEILKSKEI